MHRAYPFRLSGRDLARFCPLLDLVVVHRADAGAPDRKVESLPFAALLDAILAAKRQVIAVRGAGEVAGSCFADLLAEDRGIVELEFGVPASGSRPLTALQSALIRALSAAMCV